MVPGSFISLTRHCSPPIPKRDCSIEGNGLLGLYPGDPSTESPAV